MENTQQQKTPEQWFQMLKEPYRSEAIANITSPDEKINSLYDALYCCVSTKYKDLDFLLGSIKSGETTYLAEQELKPQDMVSGEWYVVKTEFKYLVKFDKITDKEIICFLIHDFDCIKWSAKNLCKVNSVKSIRKATREEVLEHFPDEFQEEKKEVESELENGEWYYYSDKDRFLKRSNDLDFVLKESINNGTIYKATPIAIKILKPILEPINK